MLIGLGEYTNAPHYRTVRASSHTPVDSNIVATCGDLDVAAALVEAQHGTATADPYEEM